MAQTRQRRGASMTQWMHSKDRAQRAVGTHHERLQLGACWAIRLFALHTLLVEVRRVLLWRRLDREGASANGGASHEPRGAKPHQLPHVTPLAHAKATLATPQRARTDGLELWRVERAGDGVRVEGAQAPHVEPHGDKPAQRGSAADEPLQLAAAAAAAEWVYE